MTEERISDLETALFKLILDVRKSEAQAHINLQRMVDICANLQKRLLALEHYEKARYNAALDEWLMNCNQNSTRQ